ncbi:MAG: hypothetical protein ACK5XN_29935, partial [Bacteroidota bacterium]
MKQVQRKTPDIESKEARRGFGYYLHQLYITSGAVTIVYVFVRGSKDAVWEWIKLGAPFPPPADLWMTLLFLGGLVVLGARQLMQSSIKSLSDQFATPPVRDGSDKLSVERHALMEARTEELERQAYIIVDEMKRACKDQRTTHEMLEMLLSKMQQERKGTVQLLEKQQSETCATLSAYLSLLQTPQGDGGGSSETRGRGHSQGDDTTEPKSGAGTDDGNPFIVSQATKDTYHGATSIKEAWDCIIWYGTNRQPVFLPQSGNAIEDYSGARSDSMSYGKVHV